MGTRVRSTVRAAAYLVYLALVVILCSELVLRVFALAPTDGAFTVSQAEFERIPGIFSPNRSFIETRIRPLTQRVTIDSLGYRGEESFPRERSPGELRVVVAGDSFIWGDYVVDDDTLLAQKLRTVPVVRESCGELLPVQADR